MEEFNSWCLAFHRRTKERTSLTISLFVGDVISVCRALHYCAINSAVEPGLYTASWSATLIKLDGSDYVQSAWSRAPLEFNVIDTSNLTNHFGLSNILVPCRPLMQTRPSSVIFTSTLLSHDQDDGVARDGFPELVCGDLSVLSMILDLIPVSSISNFTSLQRLPEYVFQRGHRFYTSIGPFTSGPQKVDKNPLHQVFSCVYFTGCERQSRCELGPRHASFT